MCSHLCEYSELERAELPFSVWAPYNCRLLRARLESVFCATMLILCSDQHWPWPQKALATADAQCNKQHILFIENIYVSVHALIPLHMYLPVHGSQRTALGVVSQAPSTIYRKKKLKCF